MPLPTNYTFSGNNFRIKSSVGGEYIDNISFAIVQWTHPYEPRYRPLNEWTQTNLTMVNWAGNYSSVSPGQTMFSSTPVTVTDPGALYIYIDLYNASNNVPSMNGQAWLGQITDVLTLPGGDVNINLNTANIRPMMGELVGNTLVTQDFNSWTPQAVPEPSYTALASILFVAAILLRRKK
jgi:hypothetical protein